MLACLLASLLALLSALFELSLEPSLEPSLELSLPTPCTHLSCTLSSIAQLHCLKGSTKLECIKYTDRRTDRRTDGDPRFPLLGLLSEPKIILDIYVSTETT